MTKDLQEFARALTGRRTINLYLHLPVPDKIVHEALEVATWAPNHHVTEPWRFYLLGAETKQLCVDLVRDIATAKKGEKATDRVWEAPRGLEWTVPSPAPYHTFDTPPVKRVHEESFE